MKKYFFIAIIAIISFTQISFAQVLPLKEQAAIIDEVLDERINNLLPNLMEKNKIDMWVIVSREYNEDPIIKTFLPSTWLSARRRTIIVFYYNPATKTYKKLAVARYKVGNTIEAAWDQAKFPNQWDQLNNIVATLKPTTIGLNYSTDFGHADGLDLTDYQELTKAVKLPQGANFVSASNLGVAWLETRTQREMEFYTQVNSITHKIIEEGFSSKVITPGITTTDDLVWWFRQKLNNIGLDTWFHPSVDVQRNDSANFDHLKTFSKELDNNRTILAGDLLHVDFGIKYLRLNSDIQEHAYVLKPTETDAPAYLKEGLKTANRLQDILTTNFKLNRSGNQILKAALDQAKAENIVASIYTHPIGYYGHASGPTIGMWDMQNGVPGSGDYPMYKNTCYSIELNASVLIKEWNKNVRFMLEQNGHFDGTTFYYIDGRQTSLHLVGRH
ncbi:MAG: hypothetical protein RL387_539 [Bacteroidota bacterium]|jgi:hypothetical protein